VRELGLRGLSGLEDKLKPLPDYERAPIRPSGHIPCPSALVSYPLAPSFPLESSTGSSFLYAILSFSFGFHSSNLHAKTIHCTLCPSDVSSPFHKDPESPP